MFDYINRFLRPQSDEATVTTFNELFFDRGQWRNELNLGRPNREDAIVDYYKKCLKTHGNYEYITNTRILKPTQDRTYFHLIYCTRHPKGLETFKKIDARMQPKQQQIRQEAIYEKRYTRTRQSSLWGPELIDAEPIYIANRQRRITELKNLLDNLLREFGSFKYGFFRLKGLEIEMIYEKDIKELVLTALRKGAIAIPDWEPSQRAPKEHNTMVEKAP
jgi:hypothetical protein